MASPSPPRSPPPSFSNANQSQDRQTDHNAGRTPGGGKRLSQHEYKACVTKMIEEVQKAQRFRTESLVVSIVCWITGNSNGLFGWNGDPKFRNPVTSNAWAKDMARNIPKSMKLEDMEAFVLRCKRMEDEKYEVEAMLKMLRAKAEEEMQEEFKEKMADSLGALRKSEFNPSPSGCLKGRDREHEA